MTTQPHTSASSQQSDGQEPDGQENEQETSDEAPSEASGEATGETTGETTEKTTETLVNALKAQQSKYLYLYAEFENYKKRALKERSELLKFGPENLAREMLQIIDNLERALEHAENSPSELVSGLKMVLQQFASTLSKFGVVPIESIGKRFDPEFHEAVAQEKPRDPSVEDGVILHEAQKGYLIHGRLLRPARVVVAAKK